MKTIETSKLRRTPIISMLVFALCVAAVMMIGFPAMVSAAGNVEINEANFPDANFRTWITENIAGAEDGILTAEERAAVTEMNVSGQGIASLVGIEHFTALKDLKCENNHLTSLDLSKNTALLTCYSTPQTATIAIDQQTMTYTMPVGFNRAKVTAVTGGSFSGAVLMVEEGATEVTYTYGLSFGFYSMTVTLTVENPHAHSFDEATHTCSCGATNHSFDETTHTCSCGATNHTFDEATHECACGAMDHSFDETTGVCACGAVYIDARAFPDENFCADVLNSAYQTKYDLVLTAAELAAPTYFYLYDRNITSLVGIEHFTALIDRLSKNYPKKGEIKMLHKKPSPLGGSLTLHSHLCKMTNAIFPTDLFSMLNIIRHFVQKRILSVGTDVLGGPFYR